jgi:hypothetical protein
VLQKNSLPVNGFLHFAFFSFSERNCIGDAKTKKRDWERALVSYSVALAVRGRNEKRELFSGFRSMEGLCVTQR